MPKKNVEQVIDIATTFMIKTGYTWYKVTGAKFINSSKKWEVSIDVGVTSIESKKVFVDDSNGTVVGFE